MNVNIASSEFNIQSTAFVGVVAKDRGIFHYELQKRSIDSEKFITFLRNLK